ncbi:MAG: hypothetical protein ACPHO8_08610 [Mariniblastus sp.]
MLAHATYSLDNLGFAFLRVCIRVEVYWYATLIDKVIKSFQVLTSLGRLWKTGLCPVDIGIVGFQCSKFTKLNSSLKQVGFAQLKVYNNVRNLV